MGHRDFSLRQLLNNIVVVVSTVTQERELSDENRISLEFKTDFGRQVKAFESYVLLTIIIFFSACPTEIEGIGENAQLERSSNMNAQNLKFYSIGNNLNPENLLLRRYSKESDLS
jgi:hypothetical protein